MQDFTKELFHSSKTNVTVFPYSGKEAFLFRHTELLSQFKPGFAISPKSWQFQGLDIGKIGGFPFLGTPVMGNSYLQKTIRIYQAPMGWNWKEAEVIRLLYHIAKVTISIRQIYCGEICY